MHKLKIIILTVFTLSQISCESFFEWPEEETVNYSVIGNVSFENSDLDSLLPNTIVTLWNVNQNNGCLGCQGYDYYKLGEDTVDENGNYSININAKKDNTYNLSISAKNPKSINTKYIDLSKIPNQNVDFKLKPNAYIRLNITMYDTLYNNYRYINLNFGIANQNLALLTYGSTPAKKPIVEVVGSEITKINYYSNILPQTTKYIYINKFDTTELNFVY